MPRLWYPLQPGASPGSDDGLHRRSLCRLFPLPPAPTIVIPRGRWRGTHSMSGDTKPFALSCPVPVGDSETVLLAHGGGGAMMHRLIEQVFLPRFKNPWLAAQHDGAVLAIGKERLAFTTDSYVVHPLFFPGGDIGHLAVNGTVNDLAMCGARPLYLSAGFILEEGLPMETLIRVADSMKMAAQAAGVNLVTGDTKVVDRGKGDGLFINTAGIGVVESPTPISPRSILPDRKSTRLNSSHANISYAVFCLKKKN